MTFNKGDIVIIVDDGLQLMATDTIYSIQFGSYTTNLYAKRVRLFTDISELEKVIYGLNIDQE